MSLEKEKEKDGINFDNVFYLTQYIKISSFQQVICIKLLMR